MKLPQVTLLGIDCVNIERLQFAIKASQKNIQFGSVKLLSSLPSEDPNLVKIPHIKSIEEFSRFCIEELYKYVDTDYVLLVQYDGFVLNSDSWTDKFLEYDYIGAPISAKESWKIIDLQQSFVVGNGGFSLRSKKFLEVSAKLARENKITKFHPEDVSLCVWYKDLLEQENVTFAPVDIAMKFSVQEDYGQYNKPFGFHGLFNKNMDSLITLHPEFPIYLFLPIRRKKLLEKIIEIFKPIAVESHIFGSMARGDADIFSDIDFWLVFNDENIKDVIEKRLEYYAQVGDVVHVVEPPQNSPLNGIQSSVLYKTKVGLIIVDYSLCPISNAFITKESKKLFGEIDLPVADTGFNPQKVTVPETYRIDFFIGFIFNGIKKIVRKDDEGFDNILKEYDYLSNRYGLVVNELKNKTRTFETLKEIIKNINAISTERQKNTLNEITLFLELVEKNIPVDSA